MTKPLHLAVTVLGDHSASLPERLAQTISDCGCRIHDCRMTMLGQQLALLMLLSGNWDGIAKVEDALGNLASGTDLTIQVKRTELNHSTGGSLPYAVDVICADQAGIHSKLLRFFSTNNIHIHDLHLTAYEASQTATPMINIHLSIHIPVDTAIAALRNDFMDFCEQWNLDAIVEPIK